MRATRHVKIFTAAQQTAQHLAAWIDAAAPGDEAVYFRGELGKDGSATLASFARAAMTARLVTLYQRREPVRYGKDRYILHGPLPLLMLYVARRTGRAAGNAETPPELPAFPPLCAPLARAVVALKGRARQTLRGNAIDIVFLLDGTMTGPRQLVIAANAALMDAGKALIAYPGVHAPQQRRTFAVMRSCDSADDPDTESQEATASSSSERKWAGVQDAPAACGPGPDPHGPARNGAAHGGPGYKFRTAPAASGDTGAPRPCSTTGRSSVVSPHLEAAGGQPSAVLF